MASCKRAHFRRSLLGELRLTSDFTQNQELPGESRTLGAKPKVSLGATPNRAKHRSQHGNYSSNPLPNESDGYPGQPVEKCNVFPFHAGFGAYFVDSTGLLPYDWATLVLTVVRFTLPFIVINRFPKVWPLRRTKVSTSL
jgi:hypothetical protein